MATNLNIEVSPLPRVEGHGDLVLDVKNKKIEKLQMRIPESQDFLRLCWLAGIIPNLRI